MRRSLVVDGVPGDRIVTLRHGIDVAALDLPKDRLALQRAFGFPPDVKVVTSAGRLDPSKEHMLLLEAFARVHAQRSDARLLICGESYSVPGYDQELKRRATELGLGEAVVFAGFRKDLPQLLASSDVFCLPTLHDALPLVFMMAMAAALPTVGCASGGVPELVSPRTGCSPIRAMPTRCRPTSSAC